MTAIKKENLHIIVADDHPFYLHGIKTVLRRLPYVAEVQSAENGQQVLDLLKEYNGVCDIIFMDITMPLMDGIEATRRVTTQYPGIIVIAITMNEDYKSATGMFDAGARGYLSKNIDRRELEFAIENLLSGEFYYSKNISNMLLQHLHNHNANKTASATGNAITDREMEVLKLICDGFSADEISVKLFVSTHTVNTHRRSLFEKTNTNTILGLVKYAISKGLYRVS